MQWYNGGERAWFANRYSSPLIGEAHRLCHFLMLIQRCHIQLEQEWDMTLADGSGLKPKSPAT
jgi:hypothetical protein